jgi:hypothetical protein
MILISIRKEQSDNAKRIAKHFYYGPRKLNIILTQLRNSYSFLNYDLSQVNIVNDAACSCGAPREDAFHYYQIENVVDDINIFFVC